MIRLSKHDLTNGFYQSANGNIPFTKVKDLGFCKGDTKYGEDGQVLVSHQDAMVEDAQSQYPEANAVVTIVTRGDSTSNGKAIIIEKQHHDQGMA